MDKNKTTIPLDPTGGVTQPKVRNAEAVQAPPVNTIMAEPEFISNAIKEDRTPKTPEYKPQDDQILSEGAISDFWRIIKDFIKNKQKRISDATRESVTSGSLTMEQIGFKSVVKDLVIENLQDIIEKVESTSRVIEAQKIEEQQKKADEASESSKS